MGPEKPKPARTEFQETLKSRFAKELSTLQAAGT
jgi:hypothetical protein